MLSPLFDSIHHDGENTDPDELGNVLSPGFCPPFTGQRGVNSTADNISRCSLPSPSPAYDPAANFFGSTQSSPSSIFDLPFFTPSEGSSPISLDAVDSLDLAPPSPFHFPFNLIDFPNSPRRVEEPENSFDPQVLIPCSPNADTRSLSLELPLLFQPSVHSTEDPHQSSLPDSSTMPLAPAKMLFPSQSRLNLPRFYGPTHGSDGTIDGTASAAVRIKALGDEALSAHSSRGSVTYKVESIVLTELCFY